MTHPSSLITKKKGEVLWESREVMKYKWWVENKRITRIWRSTEWHHYRRNCIHQGLFRSIFPLYEASSKDTQTLPKDTLQNPPIQYNQRRVKKKASASNSIDFSITWKKKIPPWSFQQPPSWCFCADRISPRPLPSVAVVHWCLEQPPVSCRPLRPKKLPPRLPKNRRHPKRFRTWKKLYLCANDEELSFLRPRFTTVTPDFSITVRWDPNSRRTWRMSGGSILLRNERMSLVWTLRSSTTQPHGSRAVRFSEKEIEFFFRFENPSHLLSTNVKWMEDSKFI